MINCYLKKNVRSPACSESNELVLNRMMFDWNRILVHNFIWECHHGLLKNDEKIKHINKIRYDNRLINLKLRSSNEIVVKISTNKKISYVSLVYITTFFNAILKGKMSH